MAASQHKKSRQAPAKTVAKTRDAPRAPREIELKLLLDPATLSRIRRAGALSRLPHIVPLGRGTTRNLTSLHWDTADNRLLAAGMTLRVRRDGVGVWQALKVADGARALTTDRAEDETAVSADSAYAPPRLDRVRDAGLRAKAEAAIGGAGLVPVFESAISRVARLYEDAQGTVFEAALDLGELRPADIGDGPGRGSGVRAEPVCEIELEHRLGPLAGLFTVAGAIAQRYPVRVGTTSKAARGYALAEAARRGPQGSREHQAGAAIRAILAGRSPVLPGMTLPQAYGALLAHSVSQMAANQDAVLVARAPAGVHQMRVAMRRFRAVFSAFRRAIPLPGAEQALPQIKSAFQVLGMARDLDVFCTETLPDMMKSPSQTAPPLGPLAAAAHETRLEAWQAVTAMVGGPAFTRLLLDAGHLSALARDTETGAAPSSDLQPPGHTRPGPDDGEAYAGLAAFAAGRLDKRVRQVRRRARHLATLDDEARHDLRKRLKALRYEAAFFAPLWPRADTKAFLRPLKALQDTFGTINDAATAARVAELAAARIGGESACRAAGYVGGWYAARADQAFLQVQQNWDIFDALPHFWRQPALQALR